VTPEQARACFDRAIDGELGVEEQRALAELLARDDALRHELEQLEQVVKATRSLHRAPSVNLLGGVQSRLRERSGGRFYRDRFSEGRGRGQLMWMLAAAGIMLVLTLAWWVLDLNVAVR
jgi:anti-sigma factor RsiW